jgi:very-short-patch-repair endonuclease
MSTAHDEKMTDYSERFEWTDLVRFQAGITSRRQSVRKGVSGDAVGRRVRAQRWQRMHRGVYGTFTGKPTREAVLWAAVLRAGKGAMLSHETAAEIQELTNKTSTRIHITVPAESNPARSRNIRGVVIHRSRHVHPDPQPPWQLPRTTIEDTVLDLVAASETFDEAYSWIAQATGKGHTTPASLRTALTSRKRMRWRAWLVGALDDAAEGVNSALERHYVYGVERAHGLPAAKRQSKQRVGGRTYYLDNDYQAYRLCVELDGQASHPAEERWHDARRDNVNLAASDIPTLRYGWLDCTAHRCETARQVATVLGRRGWSQGTLKPCGPACPVHRA